MYESVIQLGSCDKKYVFYFRHEYHSYYGMLWYLPVTHISVLDIAFIVYILYIVQILYILSKITDNYLIIHVQCFICTFNHFSGWSFKRLPDLSFETNV